MYLIIGADGFLGSYVLNSVLKGTDENILACSRNIEGLGETDRVRRLAFDVTDSASLDRLKSAVEGADSLKVVYLAAFHNIDKVREQPEAAYAVNVTALKSFLDAVDFDCLFFSSTDCVYGDRDGYRFKESDPLSPVNLYGEQKALAERLVLDGGGNVLRLPFMFGKSVAPRKKHFYDILSEKLLAGESADMIDGFYRSALDYAQVAEITVELCERFSSRLPRIVNVCGDDSLSKYEIGLQLAEKLGADASLVRPVAMGSFAAFTERRAACALMDNSLIKSILGVDTLKFCV